MSQHVYGTIVNYQIGIRTQMPKWSPIQTIRESAVFKAGQLIGWKVALKYGENGFTAGIMGLQGKKGALKVKFHEDIPGEALGARVELLG